MQRTKNQGYLKISCFLQDFLFARQEPLLSHNPSLRLPDAYQSTRTKNLLKTFEIFKRPISGLAEKLKETGNPEEKIKFLLNLKNNH
jgi:hypothetical protein